MKTPKIIFALSLSLTASVSPVNSQAVSGALTPRLNANQQAIQEMVNRVRRDSLLGTIRSLGEFQTRYEYTVQRDSAAEFLMQKMAGWGNVASEWYSFGTVTIRDVAPVSDSTAWFVAPGAGAFRTTDRGTTWAQSSGAISTNTYAVDFVDPSHGWVAGAGGLIAATTNGSNVTPIWIVQTSGTTSALNAIRFLDAGRGIAVGAGGAVRRTSNGGATWSGGALGGISVSLNDVCIVDSVHAWAVGSGGTVLFSSDMGASWQTQSSGSSYVLNGVKFVNPRVGWLVGAGSTILHTTNGGGLWQNVSWPGNPPANPKSVDFVDSLHGWIADVTSCSVFRTSDGGVHWQPSLVALHTNWGPTLMRVRARTATDLYVCGSRGVLRRSSDAGVAWSDQTPNLPADINHLSRNIVLTIPGTTFPSQECVMVAHYDSYSNTPTTLAPGANDNASGSSAVLEAAWIMPVYRFARTIKLVLVSAEEFGMFGSSAYVERMIAEGRAVVGAVNGDMIGYPTTTDTARLVVSSYFTRNSLVDSAVVYNTRYGVGLTLVTLLDSTGASDYSPFAISGFPAIDICEATANEIWGGADPYYHTTSDTWDKVHPGLVRRGAQLMLATVAELAGTISRDDAVESTAPLPTTSLLKPNYPNPFNPTTIIEFQLLSRQSVVLEVVDLLGRSVDVLMNQECGAGTHRVRWNAVNRAAGVYYAHLRTGTINEVRPMLLVK